MSKIIFYFTGTGNSYYVAKLLSQQMGDTQIAPLAKIQSYTLKNFQTIGVVFPVYYLHAPQLVVTLLAHLKADKHQQVFTLATYGGSWGYALPDVRQVLEKRGISPQEFRLKMPGNYILEYGALPAPYQKRISTHAKQQITSIANQIQGKKPNKKAKANTLAKLFQNTANKKIDTFQTLGTQFYTTNACNACKLCVKICPTRNIQQTAKGLVWGNNCCQCMACVQWCPQNAIGHPNIKKGRKRYTHPEVSIGNLLET